MTHDKKRLLSIGEAAKALEVTRRMILNYEDKGLILPDQRDGINGNRYYTADTVSRIRSIRSIRILQNLGLSLDDIYAYYHGTTDLEPLITRLEDLRDEISRNIEKLKEHSKGHNDFEIRQIELPAQTVYCQDLHSTELEDKKEQLRGVFIKAIRQYGSDITQHMFFTEYNLSNPGDFTCCIAVPPESQGEHLVTLPRQKALCIFYHGAYEGLPVIVKHLCAYANKYQIPLKGTARHLYLEGPPQHKNPENFLTQVAVLVADDTL